MIKSFFTMAAVFLSLAALQANALPDLQFDAAKGEFGGQKEAVVYKNNIDYQADGNVMKVTNKTPNRYCSLHLKVDFAYDADIVLSFEYRNIPGDNKIAYTAINLYDENKESCVFVFPTSTEWKTASIKLGSLVRVSDKQPFPAGTVFKELAIYSRIDNKEEPGMPSLEIRNIKFTLEKK